MTTTPDDGRIRVFYNTNIEMSRGKMAAHVAHAVLTAAGVHPGTPIVVLGAKPRDIEKMRTVMHDEGRTELEPGTLTTGTDYVFQQDAGKQEAIAELVKLAAAVEDETIVLRLSRVVDLLTGR